MPQHVVLRQNLCIELFYLVFVPHNAGNYFDTHLYIRKVEVLVTQSCPALCDPMDCSLPGSSVLGDFPGKNTGVGCHTLLQGIVPTQGSNPGLLHCRQILNLIPQRSATKLCYYPLNCSFFFQ